MSNLVDVGFGARASIADAYFESQRDAVAEACSRRQKAESVDLLTRVMPSPFGGFVVRSMPADFYAELIADGLPLEMLGSNLLSLKECV